MTQRFEDVIKKAFAANDSMKLILNTWPYIQAMSTPCAVNTLGITSLEDFKSWFITLSLTKHGLVWRQINKLIK